MSIPRAVQLLARRRPALRGLRAEGETKMTDQSAPRFVVRQGAFRDTWMLWDREIRGPAEVPGSYAIKLSEKQAQYLRDILVLEQGRE
jgi:hypothetical protein